MRGAARAAILSLVLFLLWDTFLTAPFRWFAKAFRDLSVMSAEALRFPSVLQGFLLVLFLLVVTIALLVLTSKNVVRHLAGACAAASLIYYVIVSIRSMSLDGDMIWVTAGVCIAFLMLLFRTEKPNLYFADAFILAIPVMLFRELVLGAVFSRANIDPDLLSPVIHVPTDLISDRIGDFLGLPMPVWSIFLFALVATSVIFFARARD